MKSAQIDLPLSMPRIREVETAGAEWAVKRRLEIWDHVAFRNERIARREGQVLVCGEVRADPASDYTRFVVTGGGVSLATDEGGDFDQLWRNACDVG